MDAVIIAAGEGTRMRPLTVNRPKPLLPIGKQSLIERLMSQCVEYVDHFVLVVGYQSEKVQEQIGTEFDGTPITYATQEEQLGTAHAVQQAQPHVTGPFIVLNGDVFVDESLIAQLATSTPPALTTTAVESPESYGVIETNEDVITGLYEKPSDPPTNKINVGLYAFEPTVFDAIERVGRSPRGEYEITDAIEILIDENHKVKSVEYSGQWIDVGRPWELLTAMEQHLNGLEEQSSGTIESGVDIVGPVSIDQGAHVRSGAYLEGPVVIEKDAEVGPNAYIRGPAVIGPAASVGHAVEIKNSILMSDASVNHLSYVGDSILSNGVNFGAGTVVANLRHDEEQISMQVKGKTTSTGRRKLGAVVGPDVKTGVNTSLCPGVKLPAGARTNPGETVYESE